MVFDLWFRWVFSGFNVFKFVRALIEHHLAIAKNIPLEAIIKWITNLAPVGLIEFIPKEDETIKTMLENREDIFDTYNEINFEKILSNKAKIIMKENISGSKRFIYEFKTL